MDRAPRPRLARGCAMIVLLLVSLTLTGCSPQEQQPTEAAATRTLDQIAADTVLETVEWGQVGALVSVMVRNHADRILRRAEAVVSVRATDDAAAPALTTVQGPCCTVIEVPPGGSYGFSFYVSDTTQVDTLEVTYNNLQWSGGATTGASTATVRPAHLFYNKSGSAVTADVSADGGPLDAVVVQAVIDGPDGRFVAVVSGTWYCFVPGPPRRILMQLYLPLPEGSTTRSVTAYPKPDEQPGGDANAEASCDPASSVSGGSTGS